MPGLKRFLFILIIAFVTKRSPAQNHIVDSLNLILKKATHDTTRLHLLVRLSEECELKDVASYAENAVQLADKLLQDRPGLNVKTNILIQKARAFSNLGFVYENRGDISMAMNYHGKSLKLFEENGDKAGVGNTLNSLGLICFEQGRISNAMNYYNRSLKIREAINDKRDIAITLCNIGVLYNHQGNISGALNYYARSLKIQEEIGDKEGIAISLNNAAVIYNNQGDISKALDLWSKSLKIQEEIGDKNGIANSLNNIGAVYNYQGNASGALEYYNRSLKLREETGDKNDIATSLNNIGHIYQKQNNIPLALNYYERSLKLREELGAKGNIAQSLNNIATIYGMQGNAPKMLLFYSNSLKLQKQVGDKRGVVYLFNNIGSAYYNLSATTSANHKKDLILANSYCDSALVIAKELGFPEYIRDSEINLSKIDSARGNFLGAFDHYKQFIIYRDSIDNKETRKASIKNQLKYEYEKKEAVIKEQQDKERAVSEEKHRRQQIAIWAVAAGLLLVIGFAIFVFRTLKITREQKVIIEEKQKEVLDSIRYAKRIQQSLLPNEKHIAKQMARLSRVKPCD